MRPEDRRWVVSTWVRSFADYAPWGPALTRARHWCVVDAILDAAPTRVVVLASDEAARTLHAWAAASDDALHFAYTPPDLRGHGLARRCIEAALGCYPRVIPTSHPWPFTRGVARFRWNPYALPMAALEKAA